MNILIAVIIKDFKLIINKSFALIGMLLLPLIFMAILLFSFSDILYKKVFMEPFSIMVWDKDSSKYSALLVNQFGELNVFKSMELAKDEKQANTYLQKGYAALIVIPENFIQLTSVGKNPPITVIGNSTMPFRANLVKNLVQTASNYVTAGQSSLNTMYYFNWKLGFTQSEIDTAFREALYKSFIQILGRKEAFENITVENSYNASVPISIVAACLTLFMGFSGMPVVKILLEEKISKVSLRLKGAKVGLLTSFFSKFLITLLISLLQILILYFCAIKFFNIDIEINLVRFLSVATLAVFSFSGFSTFIVAISKTHFMADIIGNLSLFLMAIASGCFYPLYTLPEVVRSIGSYSIHSQVMEGFLKIFTNSHQSLMWTYLLLGFLGGGLYLMAFFTTKHKELT